jgi:uncharacterized protein
MKGFSKMTDYERCTKNESTIMMIMTLAVMFFNIIGAIIAYVTCQVYGKQSAFIKRNGARLIDFYISFVIYEIIVLLLCLVKIGTYLLPIMTLIYAAICVIAIIQYYKHKEFIYPLTFKFIQRLK